MDLPYYPALVEIRGALEETIPGYPHDRCRHASRLVSQILGLEQVAGIYGPTSQWHAMNYDRDRHVYVDLSCDQFPGVQEKIVILPWRTTFFEPSEGKTRFQTKMDLPKIEDKLKPARDLLAQRGLVALAEQGHAH